MTDYTRKLYNLLIERSMNATAPMRSVSFTEIKNMFGCTTDVTAAQLANSLLVEIRNEGHNVKWNNQTGEAYLDQ